MTLIEQIPKPISCNNYKTIISGGGKVVENLDGTVSVYKTNNQNILVPVIITYTCCKVIKPNYIFDIDTQTCRWSEPTTCSLDNVFKLTLNPKGNDGSLFLLENDENCFLSIGFDYLFKIKCETLVNLVNSQSIAPTINPKITILQTSLAEQKKECDYLTGIINDYNDNIAKTFYSIICYSVPIVTNTPVLQVPLTGRASTTAVKSVGTKNSTGFGVAPYSVGPKDSLVAGQIYCITEPQGLNEWNKILGDIKYNEFISGVPNSYNCDDVNKLFDKNNIIVINNTVNKTNLPELIITCDTPINTKSDLKKKVSEYLTEQAICQEKIITLSNELTSLQNVEEEIKHCSTILDVFELLDVSVTVDVITSANTLQTVFEYQLFPTIGKGKLYNYLINNSNSGFYVCGDPSVSETTLSNCTPLTLEISSITTPNVYTCESIMGDIVNGLFSESGLGSISGGTNIFASQLKTNAFSSQWLHYKTLITDPNIIALIANEKIKLTLKINHTCSDFCVLMDNIVLDKICTYTSGSNIFLSKSPGFELDRIRDNKKSWVDNTTLVNRPFSISNNLGGNSIRQTNYDVNDERLVINSKEIDLDISIASAIETDVWCYLVDNPCLLTGITICNPCEIVCGNKTFQDAECYEFMDNYTYEFMDGSGSTFGIGITVCCGDNMIDFTNLLTQSLSAITTIEDFEYFMTSELIDVKNRKTLSGYPTLRALYDRYINSSLYCGTNSSRFDYLTMDQFAKLVGNYWVDIVEQVIPSTTIWGSVKVYSNTIFDQQKFKYKAYSSLFCSNPFIGEVVSSPIFGVNGKCVNVSVSMTPITKPSDLSINKPVTSYCNTLCLAQMDTGSEFIGTVTIITN